jgi:hypothetical protein
MALIIKLGNLFLNYKLLYWNSVYNTILIENNNSVLIESKTKVQYYADCALPDNSHGMYWDINTAEAAEFYS